MKRTLLILCALLAMAYSAGTQAQNVWDGTVADSFAGGSGTAEEPYQIADGAQLARFASMVNGGQTSINGRLTADILLNDISDWETWDESTEGLNSWTPIGSDANPFTGTLDGDGHSVSGIYINSTANCQGLVGYLGSGGTLQNLGVKASYIKGGYYVGGLCGYNSGTVTNCYNSGSVTGGRSVGGVCGYNYSGTVTNCYNTGSVTGTGSDVGGVCGTNSGANVSNCYNSGNVAGTGDSVGGVCGDNSGNVTNCYNTGSVTGTGDYVGGLCGKIWMISTVTNCYNTGSVTGSNYVGGVCGINSSIVTNCYNTGSVTGTGDYIGGLCGRNYGGDVTNCYYLNTCGAAGEGTSKNADEFASGEVAWLLGEGWGQTIGTDDYPVLGGEKVLQIGNGYVNELKQDGDGFYLISTANELRLFAAIVNGTDGMAQNTAAKGKLTADILLNDTANWKNWNESTTGLNSWTPIGSEANRFTGTLDGDGHSVSGIYINSTASSQGLVGYLGEGGTLQNVGVKASYIKGGDSVGGLCGLNVGTVNNCYNTGKVAGTNCVGGVCGVNYGTVTNCYNTGSVKGMVEPFGGVYGANAGTVSNCYYLTGTANGGIGLNYGQAEAEAKTAEQFQSGEVAWLLSTGKNGEIWGQNISFEPKDSYPVLGGLKVVQNGDGYKNELSQDGDFYLISTADELRLFAAIVNGTDGMTQNTAAKGRLTADILLNNTEGWENWGSTAPANSWTPIGSDANPFTGTLDGDGHSVSGIYINSEADCQGLVGYLGEGGTLQNVGVKASYIKGRSNVGGLCGRNQGTVTNCYNTGSVTGTSSVGGLCGMNYNTVTNCYNTGSVTGGHYVGGVCGMNEMGTVTNCYNSGNVAGSSDYVGGVCGMNYGTVTNCYNTGKVAGNGYVGGLCGDNRNTVTNCYNSGSVNGNSEVGGVCGMNMMGTVTNCYYLTGTAAGGIGSNFGQAEAEAKTETEFASGEVAWLLSTGENGEIWGQNISFEPKDSYPVLGGEKVYQYSDGTYGNTPLQAGEDGFYLISNADELRRFADMVNSGQTSIKGRLTADILLNDISGWENWNESTEGLNSWTPIGTSYEQSFTGTLDGDGHSVSGIYINSTANYQGLVGILGEGGTLQNVGVKASYIKGGNSVGGVCGQNNYGIVTNCYNTGSVEGTSEVGGVCGKNRGGNVTNCYNTGSVTGNDYVGGVCGVNEMGDMTNCYNTGSVAGGRSVGGVCGSNDGPVTNCYYLDTCGAAGEGTSKTADEFASGEVAWLLNGSTSEGETLAWYQNLGNGQTVDDYPVLTADEAMRVYQLTLTDGGNATAFYANSGNFTLPVPAGREGYTFAGWFTTQADGTQVQDNATLTADITLYAQWTANSYTIRFVNADGTELQSSEVEYGQRPAYNGETPTKESTAEFDYAFAGWDPEIAIVTGDATYTATYTETRRSYTITFVDEDGTTVLQSSEVEYGQRPAYNGETPTKASTAEFDYAFAGWDPEIDIVTGDATYTATYTETKRSYTVTFVDEDGTSVLQTSMVEYGQTPVYSGNTPTKASTAEFDYTFAGWTPDIASVTGDATYKATYTETRRSYTITFVDEDGTTVLQSSEVGYGQMPVYSGNTPTKASTAEFDYTFAGWTPGIATVTGDATYTATYTATRRSYTVTLALADGCENMGEVSGGGNYEYGTQVTLTATANEGYKFVQWSDGDENATRTITVTGDLMLTATFAATDPTALHTPEAGAWKAIGTDGMLRITGTDAEMAVYDMRGALVYRGTARTLHVTAGAYIVRIGNEVQKAVVK